MSPAARPRRLLGVVLLASSLAFVAAGCTFSESGALGPNISPRDVAAGNDDAARPDGLTPPDLDAGPPPDSGADLALILPDGATDLPQADVSAGCSVPRKCEKDIYFECVNGQLKQQQACPLGCNGSGTACAVLVPSNIEAKFLGLGAGDWTITGEVILDTTSGAISSGGSAQSFPAGVQFFATADYAILTVKNLQVGSGARLWVRGKRPLVIAASERVRIVGTLDASANGRQAGPGGGNGGGNAAGGEGGCAGPGGRSPQINRYTAGAGGSFGGRGGNGGGSGGSAGPASLTPCGVSDLVPLTGGSGGGGGDGAFGTGGDGGGGGGALQLTAKVSIEVVASGVVHVGGGRGERGSSWTGAAGGGGSGGAVLLEAPKVKIDGVIAANGGGGGGGGIWPDSGENGEDGKPSDKRAKGGSGTDNVIGRAGDGGEGSGGKEIDGKPGEDKAPAGGGGGGGAGRIVLRSSDGKYGGGKLSGVVNKLKVLTK